MHDACPPPFPPYRLAILQRTKAGAKLAVPRPVNLPSLKKASPLPSLKFVASPPSVLPFDRFPTHACCPHLQENAGSEATTTGGGAGGWAGTAAAAEHDQQHSSYVGGDAPQQPASSLVEKASWAGQGRPAGPAPWEAGPPQRSLNPREFPSLAAAAAVPQQPHGHRTPPPAHAAESGAWDEDERGRGPPAGLGRPPSADRGPSPHRFYPGDRGEGYGYRGPPPQHYGRHRGEPSPHQRFGDEEFDGRYGGREPFWRDEPQPRDWHPRHDRWVCRLVCCFGSVRCCLVSRNTNVLGPAVLAGRVKPSARPC